MHSPTRLGFVLGLLVVGLAACAPQATVEPTETPPTEPSTQPVPSEVTGPLTTVEPTELPPTEAETTETPPTQTPAQPTETDTPAPPTATTQPPPTRALALPTLEDDYGLVQDNGEVIGIALNSRTGQTITVAQRVLACDEFWPLSPFDGEAVAAANPDKTFMWTVMVNFDSWVDPDPQPLGCLRIYRRVASGSILRQTATEVVNDVFVQADGGGYALNTCTVSPGVASASAEQAAWLTDGTDTDFVLCEVNLIKWVSQLWLGGAFDDPEMPPVGAETTFYQEANTFTTTVQAYTNLTMVAVVAIDQGLDDGRWSVLCYLPHGMAACTAHVDVSKDGGTMLFPPDCSPGPQATPHPHTIDTDASKLHYVWWEAQGTARPYTMADAASVAITPVPTDRCDYDPDQLPAIEFPISLAALRIGLNLDDTAFQGQIDGIIVDPLDSNPPGDASVTGTEEPGG